MLLGEDWSWSWTLRSSGKVGDLVEMERWGPACPKVAAFPGVDSSDMAMKRKRSKGLRKSWTVRVGRTKDVTIMEKIKRSEKRGREKEKHVASRRREQDGVEEAQDQEK